LFSAITGQEARELEMTKLEDGRPVRSEFEDAKEYRRAYDRWRDKNNPKRRARNSDPNRLAATRAWYAANREAVLQQKKTYFQENKGQIREYQRGYVKERYHADPEFRAKSIKRARASAVANPERVRELAIQRYHANPVVREKDNQRSRKYAAENASEIAEQRAKFRAENREVLAERSRQWRTENRPKFLSSLKKYRDENRVQITEQARQRRESDPEWAAHLDAYRKEYYSNNKHKYIARNALREERIQRATPPWLTKEQRLEMELVYRDAAELTALTGVRHEVDHIHPIKGRKSCGLHVPWNLQVLTWKENSRKRNREPAE
jgi:5-methylcytosine-specific restriction endonuclease McrA